jgi:hypothetical protein
MLVSLKLGADFARGCALSAIGPALPLTRPTLPFVDRFIVYCFRLSRFLPLTAVNKHSLLQYLVLSNKLQGGAIGHPLLP